MNYYVLSLSRKNNEALVWWKPDNSGYTINLAEAGKYSHEQVESNKPYYDNGKEAIAIPCHSVEEYAIKIVPANTDMENLRAKFPKHSNILNGKELRIAAKKGLKVEYVEEYAIPNTNGRIRNRSQECVLEKVDNNIYAIGMSELNHINLNEYKDGEFVCGDFYGEVGRYEVRKVKGVKYV
jgi:hypothetical protein